MNDFEHGARRDRSLDAIGVVCLLNLLLVFQLYHGGLQHRLSNMFMKVM